MKMEDTRENRSELGDIARNDIVCMYIVQTRVENREVVRVVRSGSSYNYMRNVA